MDLLCLRPKSNGFFARGSMSEKPICWSSRNQSVYMEIKVGRTESLTGYSRLMVKAMAKKNTGNSSNSNSNSSSGNNDHKKSGGDELKGNSPMESHTNSDSNAQKVPRKPLDWREFRASLYTQEQADNADSSAGPTNKASPASQSLPLKWAHPISAPENGCLLVATETLDGVRTFARTVVLLLRSGTRNPLEDPFGVIINRPLNKKMKHMNPTLNGLTTTFADCPLHFGGPLEATMFLVRAGEKIELPGLGEVIPGVYFGGDRNSLDEAAALVKNGKLRPQDFGFFMGNVAWQLDQLREEIESDFWYVAACSANLIADVSENSSSDSLWQEVLQLMGGHYSELSRKPKEDI